MKYTIIKKGGRKMKKFITSFILTLIFLSPFLLLKADPAEPKLRWAGDRLVYTGEVNVNEWALGVDDDVIDVDYFAGDTLRAVVACPDSAVRILRSNDNGQSWAQVGAIGPTTVGAVTEPYIVHGPDSTYHVFVRFLTDANNRLYTQARRTYNDVYILGTGEYIEASGDSVNSYSVCTDRAFNHDYTVYLIYNEGTGDSATNQLTKTTDLGQTWSPPARTNYPDVTFPDITCAGTDLLYLTYTYTSATNTSYVRARRSENGGSTWTTWEDLEADTMPKLRSKIAAALDGSGEVWVIWSKMIIGSPNNDWDLRWAWSQDSADNFSAAATVNSVVDSNETMPSIAVFDAYGSNSSTPHVTFIKGYYDWTGSISVQQFAWSGGSWGTDTVRSDNAAYLSRPIQTFISSGFPAIAYVGENAENVYFDSWANSSGIEEDDIAVSKGKIECCLDRNIILGTAALKYSLPTATKVEVSLINILGQKVATLDDGEKNSGEHTLSVSAENLSQGIYYIVITTGNGQKGIIKATVLK
jgi:hypothetical protein